MSDNENESSQYVVDEDGLNFRSEPRVRAGNRIAVLTRGQSVYKLADARPGWWHVGVQLAGLSVQGYVAYRFLAPAKRARPLPERRGRIAAVHMSPPKGRRDADRSRAYPLGESGQPTRAASTPSAKARRITRIVEYLDVENNVRHRGGSGKTYCNIYAYDFCYLCGVYLPRVWWYSQAIRKLAQGESVTVNYGTTIHELNANALYDWLADEGWGAEFGWVRTFSLTELQEAANEGRVAIICARRGDRNRSGHICAVVPETSEHKGKRTNTEVTQPLQSQAGASNHRYWTHVWWTGSRFEAYGFWHTDKTRTWVRA